MQHFYFSLVVIQYTSTSSPRIWPGNRKMLCFLYNALVYSWQVYPWGAIMNWGAIVHLMEVSLISSSSQWRIQRGPGAWTPFLKNLPPPWSQVTLSGLGGNELHPLVENFDLGLSYVRMYTVYVFNNSWFQVTLSGLAGHELGPQFRECQDPLDS